MNEAFYNKFLSLFFGFIMVLFLFLVTIELLIFYFTTQNAIFYYLYCGVLVFSSFYGIRCYSEFKYFLENLYLFLPSERNSEKNCLKPLNMEVEDLPLKVCILYRNGLSFERIREKLGLNHIYQVKRELINGLDLLLKNYEKHEEELKVEH